MTLIINQCDGSTLLRRVCLYCTDSALLNHYNCDTVSKLDENKVKHPVKYPVQPGSLFLLGISS